MIRQAFLDWTENPIIQYTERNIDISYFPKRNMWRESADAPGMVQRQTEEIDNMEVS